MIYRDAVDANTAKRYWESIKASILTSFYTDTRIVSAIADALSSADVPIRRCLDPSAGMGAFSEVFAKKSGMVDAMEKDLLTARISQAIHPYGQGNIIVRQAPFEAIRELEDKEKYDLITSNIPFGDFMVYDREYSKGKNILKHESTRAIHNYFFVKDWTVSRKAVCWLSSPHRVYWTVRRMKPSVITSCRTAGLFLPYDYHRVCFPKTQGRKLAATSLSFKSNRERKSARV